jgi:hypothetical protein
VQCVDILTSGLCTLLLLQVAWAPLPGGCERHAEQVDQQRSASVESLHPEGVLGLWLSLPTGAVLTSYTLVPCHSLGRFGT